MNTVRDNIKALIIILEDELGVIEAWPITNKLNEALQWLRDPWDNSINWRQLWDMGWKCAEPVALGCYLHYKAWLMAPPGTNLEQRTVTLTTGGGKPASVEVQTQTTSVEPKP